MNPGLNESHRLAQDIERWVGSPWRRVLLATVITLTAALVTTVQVAETLDLRRPERHYEWSDVYLQQLCVWAPWGLVGGPLVILARAIFRWRRSWMVAGLVQIPLSIAVAFAFQLYEDALANLVFADDWLAPLRLSGHAWFRFTRELLVYWLVLASGAAVYSFLKSQSEERKAAELRLREAELAGEIARARLDTLRSQLHPHFLFNALHSVGGLVREGEGKRALQVLASIAALLRTTLDQGDAHEVALSDELDATSRYLEIERVRFGERLRFELEVEEAARVARVPALALLTLAENAVRHGVSKREEGGRIAIRARVQGSSLRLEVEDDGPGFPAEILARGELARDERGRHIGLENTRRRLALLYGDAHTFRLENASPGARIVIAIPLRSLDSTSPAPTSPATRTPAGAEVRRG